MGKISWELLDGELAKTKNILGGERCHICGKEITLKRGVTSPFENQQGLGFIRIAMGEHLKAHIRHGDIELCQH